MLRNSGITSSLVGTRGDQKEAGTLETKSSIKEVVGMGASVDLCLKDMLWWEWRGQLITNPRTFPSKVSKAPDVKTSEYTVP